MRVSALFRGLLDGVSGYALPALQMAYEDFAAAAAGGRVGPDSGGPVFAGYLAVPRACLEITQITQLHFERCVLGYVAVSPAVHRDLVGGKNAVFAQVEAAANKLLSRIVGACVRYLEALLGRQKRNDYKSKGAATGSSPMLLASLGHSSSSVTSAAVSTSATAVCTAACEFLKRMYADVAGYLTGDNLVSFLVQVGTSYHGYPFFPLF